MKMGLFMVNNGCRLNISLKQFIRMVCCRRIGEALQLYAYSWNDFKEIIHYRRALTEVSWPCNFLHYLSPI